MNKKFSRTLYAIATVFTVALLFGACQDKYKRVGEEASARIFPQGIAENFTVTYTEMTEPLSSQDSSLSKVVFTLRSPRNENYDNLEFGHQIFPNGVEVDFFDKQGRKSTVVADYGILYSDTNVIDLQGNVLITNHDGKMLETPQLYWDRTNKWIFTEAKFTYTNPEDGTVMDGEGMDFNNDFTYFNAHKTYGLMTITEED
ncbi:LPS export ABC transporter periplasmic protein LptC [Croceivirga thetidis]|uniref:LPS export ABC transporter periplasmic protein LptC n=1 Tax=Croceivirga thetidis TaxID=2721623 RepID=A0ABX1GP25_9FLAO|nr:LPS export ABC transporter periplasmic protein LptC [Croceivirga thetidis]NKI31682.1 LPS export ABC transporter periplasmic protein LptC [Croceivirga thetidis]